MIIHIYAKVSNNMLSILGMRIGAKLFGLFLKMALDMDAE
ncbi:hypothetical protein BTHERMOSOX_615 [Bathymodiolus thermophilus thioautotrophic gill symbiont]|nr:hypothetical protein BTHERMOSOX_615 [Bathymodiolus thermophilus thioautotrophic gill symbiont]